MKNNGDSNDDDDDNNSNNKYDNAKTKQNKNTEFYTKYVKNKQGHLQLYNIKYTYVPSCQDKYDETIFFPPLCYLQMRTHD